MRSIIAILLLLCVMGVFFTPSVEDDVDGTAPVFVDFVSGGIVVESNLRSVGHSPATSQVTQPGAFPIPVSVLRC